MENIIADIDTRMELDDLESAESGDHSTSVQSETLLDMPVEVIEMILSHLNLEDKKNFGLTSKKYNEILSNCEDLWKDVWLRVPDQETPKASELTRKYVNLRCAPNVFIKLANDGIFAHLSESLKCLVVDYTPDSRYFRLSLKCLTSTLPFFENLVHWDFSGVKTLQDDIVDESTVNDQNLQSVAVEMKKLKHLRMRRSVFLKLNGRFVNFSTTALKSLSIYTYHDQFVEYGEYYEYYGYDEKAIVPLIARQKNLEILILLGLNTLVIFDEPLKTEAQLRQIQLEFREDLNAQQQNNMCNFLDSQKGLEQQRIYWYGQKTNRLLDYQMRLMDSTVAKQYIDILRHSRIQRNFWDIDSKILRINSYSTEFLSYPHQENLNTVNLYLRIGFIPVLEVEAIITRICEKFPNLKDLEIELEGDYLSAAMSNLSNLGRLEKLESLELIGFTSSPNRLLNNVTIPSLKKFVGHEMDFLASKKNRHVKSVKNFMNRHVNLNYVKLNFMDHPTPSLSLFSKEATENFADSGFKMKKEFNSIILTKGEKEN